MRLRPIIGKTEIITPLGPDRREAMRRLPGAVAELQRILEDAGHRLHGTTAPSTPATAEDAARLAWLRYQALTQADATTRDSYPTPAEIEAERQRIVDRFTAEGMPDDPVAILSASLDYLVKREAKALDAARRAQQIDALRQSLAEGQPRISHEVADYLAQHRLSATEGDRLALGQAATRAEIEALQRSLERDRGNFTGQPTDPAVQPLQDRVAPVSIKALFRDYIRARQLLGHHRDGGAGWEPIILHLRKFLAHDDAQRITRKDLIAWRDRLLSEGISPASVAKRHLAAVRAVLRWAFDEGKLPADPSAGVRQAVPKRIRSRERGFTDAEALAVLRLALNHQPGAKESAHIAAAKKWLPILGAFTGARIAELAQLRTEDFRQEHGRWIMRITPDAGSVKTGQFRDVPLHPQLDSLGFVAFVTAHKPGPLFHAAKDPAEYLARARATAGRVTQWLQAQEIIPAGVQPSHAWRHRFKTQARELGLSDRVADAIQGHAARTASDNYGDVSVPARVRFIDSMPAFDGIS